MGGFESKKKKIKDDRYSNLFEKGFKRRNGVIFSPISQKLKIYFSSDFKPDFYFSEFFFCFCHLSFFIFQINIFPGTKLDPNFGQFHFLLKKFNAIFFTFLFCGKKNERKNNEVEKNIFPLKQILKAWKNINSH